MKQPLMNSLMSVAYGVAVLALAPAAGAVPTYSIVPLGLAGLEHTRDDGAKTSISTYLNDAGQVVGYENRYNGGSAELGQSAWLYDGLVTRNIGLTGPNIPETMTTSTAMPVSACSIRDRSSTTWGRSSGTPNATTAAAPIWA